MGKDSFIAIGDEDLILRSLVVYTVALLQPVWTSKSLKKKIRHFSDGYSSRKCSVVLNTRSICCNLSSFGIQAIANRFLYHILKFPRTLNERICNAFLVHITALNGQMKEQHKCTVWTMNERRKEPTLHSQALIGPDKQDKIIATMTLTLFYTHATSNAQKKITPTSVETLRIKSSESAHAICRCIWAK